MNRNLPTTWRWARGGQGRKVNQTFLLEWFSQFKVTCIKCHNGWQLWGQRGQQLHSRFNGAGQYLSSPQHTSVITQRGGKLWLPRSLFFIFFLTIIFIQPFLYGVAYSCRLGFAMLTLQATPLATCMYTESRVSSGVIIVKSWIQF